jgi:nucleotide-binding universal stress UspA family protein
MFQTILLPLDGSETGAQAIPAASEMARRFGGRVHLVQVVDTGTASLALGANAAAGGVTDPAAITGEVNERVEVAKAYLAAVAEQLAGDGIEATYEIHDGPEGDGIVEAAATAGAELIVMSSHGRGGLGRLVFGSVADHVIRHAAAPVMVIRAVEHPG